MFNFLPFKLMKYYHSITIKIYILFLFLSQVTNAQKLNWETDLAIFASQLEKKHIALYNKISKQEFKKAVNKIASKSKKINDFEVIIELMKLTREIGDGHTAISLRNIETHQFPIEISYIQKKWRVTKVSKTHKKILKSSIIAIDGVPIQEVIGKISEVSQFVENKYSKTVRTGSYLTISELLFNLKITKKLKSAVFTFLDEDTKISKVNLKALQKSELEKVEFKELKISVPEISKPKETKFDYLWYAPIKNTNAVYINFESYPSFDDMQVFGEDLVNYISKNSISNVVIDLRNNGGGDLYVGIILAYALNLADTIDWKNGVYVMCSNVTFSAGTSNVALYKQLLNAKIVGQPTGSNPSGYQDMGQFNLPNSNLVITYSKRKFMLSETIKQGVQPNILLYYSWKDYKQGKDTMLNWIVNNVNK